jgi:hypothetical protein
MFLEVLKLEGQKQYRYFFGPFQSEEDLNFLKERFQRQNKEGACSNRFKYIPCDHLPVGELMKLPYKPSFMELEGVFIWVRKRQEENVQSNN